MIHTDNSIAARYRARLQAPRCDVNRVCAQAAEEALWVRGGNQSQLMGFRDGSTLKVRLDG